MYHISDTQIDYILNDIRRNGVEMEDLQYNLLDHICCIIERELEAGGDFERFYRATVKQFYKNELREIEEETIDLLTFKNYYAMKKIMIVSGALSVAAFIAGSAMKLAHARGTGLILLLAICIFAFLFLPLMFILKAKETTTTRDKLTLASAVAVGVLFSMATLFSVMHWPGASSGILWFSAIGISAFVLIPTYFLTGIRRPETKLNTILTTVLLVAFVGLQFTMVNTRPIDPQNDVRMYNYAQSQQLLSNMRRTANIHGAAEDVDRVCEHIKGLVLENMIGMPTVPNDIENSGITFQEGSTGPDFTGNGQGVQLLVMLRDAVDRYNSPKPNAARLPVKHSVLSIAPGKVGKAYSNVSLLNSITQLQLYLASAETAQPVAAR